MAVVFPGDGVIELIRGAHTRVIIAAPYIKSSALRRLLDVVPETVTECVCITRWLPEDIASGVCDISILDDLERVRGQRLLVHPCLHAKYYSNGRETLVGSANLTVRGLGWHTPSNVELLVALPAEFAGLAEWERALMNSAALATPELRDQLRVQADELRQARAIHHVPEVEGNTGEENTALWVPQCPTPDRLWQVYLGRGADTMVSSAFEAAQEDLAALSLPPGLTQELFTTYVAGIFKQTPLLMEIDKLVSAGLTDTQAHELLAEHLGDAEHDRDYDQAWRIVKHWLVHFFPQSYRLEASHEVLVRGREIPKR